MEEGLTEADIERTHSVGKPKQNKKKPRPVSIKFVRYNCSWRIFLNKKKLNNTGISVTKNLTGKCMEILTNAKERLASEMYGH